MTTMTPWQINKSTSYFIPYVHPETTEDYIKDVFEIRSKIGKVKRVDISRYLCNKTMRPKSRAFVHLDCVYDTPFSLRFRENIAQQDPARNKLRHGGYSSNKFWTVLPYRSKETRSTMSTNTIRSPPLRIDPVLLPNDDDSMNEYRPVSPIYIPSEDLPEDYRPPSPDYPPDEHYPANYLTA